LTPPEATETGEFAEFFHTDDLPNKPEPVSHRGAIEASPFMRKLLAPVTAVVVVVVVILLLIWINGGSSGTTQSPAAVGGGPRTNAPGAPTSHSAPPAPTSSTTLPVTTNTRSAGPKPPAGIGPTKHDHPTAPTAMAPVTVLNNSRRTGLAASVAAELRGRKWQVSGVGNQTHTIPVTTVYYASGEHGAAMHLAHDFSSVQRIAPNSAGGIRGSGLTLVVTQSWVL
jgi:hypothetical protein